MANTYGSITDVDAWEPINGSVRSCPCCRSLERLGQVIDQFQHDTNPRYKPRDLNGDGKGDTFCNVAVTDFLEHMGVYGPHWWLGKELNANALVDWFNGVGKSYGWSACTRAEAIASANSGRPVIVGWKNPSGGSGHVAIVRGQVEASEEPVIAQAGRVCFSSGPLSKGFGNLAVTFWRHD